MIDQVVRYADRLDADRFSEVGPPGSRGGRASAFPQPPGLLDPLIGPALADMPVDEDAFTLRIQARSGARDLPVLLYVPGGGFTTGSGHARWFTAPRLVAEQGVVLVTVNHRLGALGHLGPDDDPACSARPLRDLVQAVRWVHAHIGEYGGDPSSITMAGDSAGAWYAWALSSAPATRGLLARTLLVSMPRLTPLSAQDHELRRRLFLDALGQPPQSLATVPVGHVLEAQVVASRGYTGTGFAFAPAACDDAPAELGDAAASGAALHTGALWLLTTSDEGSAFLRPTQASYGDDAAYWQAVHDLTARVFTTWADEVAWHAPVPAHRVRFHARSPLAGTRSTHCLPLPFLFGTGGWYDAPMLEGLDPADLARCSAALQEAAFGFVRDGGGTDLEIG